MREELVDFNYCKDLARVLFKVIGKQRQAVVSERPIFTMVDDQEKPIDPSQYPPDQLPLEEGIVNWTQFEPELDRFNK